MRTAKTLAATAMIAATALATTACAGGTGTAEPTDDIDLRMTVWTSNDDHLALFDSIAEEYMADHPEISSITFDPLPFDDYTSTVTTQIAGGNAPDLAWILENAAPDFVASGALEPLTEVLEATEGYEYDDLVPSALELWEQDGDLLAYPFSTSPFVVFANDDMLAEAGQPTSGEMLASGDWNWETVSEVGAAVHEATGNAGFVIRDFDYLNWDYLSTVWNGWGAAPWSADGTECTFASPEMVDAFTFLHDAAFTTESMPGPGTTADFFAGEAAFTVTQISRANLLPEGGFAWDLLPLPEGPVGEYSVTGQAGIGAMAQGAQPTAAAEFLAFFTNPENSEKLAQYFPPPRASQLNVETLAAANPLLTSEQIETVVVPGIETGQVRPSHTDSGQISQQVRASLDNLWVADADIPAVLESTCESIAPLLG
ncbi:ABC transporter substrate-binding protein [Microbacterium xanthum]|uniref:ABC transporter substrate-binding protein n=1 Tax=Microbacterium xanthum TaxID=3079794 RepID=UPI002AD20269|nr:MULTISPECIES: sugar ABC transporter substrate-binding protein [unclassified Microbacterium]MDZ8170711.1 sugar ABC transporter substrate-binding protein [Microbacterium sp. KSW-48]MDZ8201237.1 sugar ABC transporter substrate-binding protein [Microbacterium sp. SSW1-59]